MSRLIARLLSCVFTGLVAATGAELAEAQQELHCESKALSYKSREVECPLDAAAAAQRFRFKANFTGSHDDTTANMTASLNGSALACDEGSKTSSEGEDGDVTLECKFSVMEQAETRSVLKVALHWHHAELTDFELYPE